VGCVAYFPLGAAPAGVSKEALREHKVGIASGVRHGQQTACPRLTMPGRCRSSSAIPVHNSSSRSTSAGASGTAKPAAPIVARETMDQGADATPLPLRRVDSMYNPFKCNHERHVYEKCQYEAYVLFVFLLACHLHASGRAVPRAHPDATSATIGT
jgi:hypothetical protein